MFATLRNLHALRLPRLGLGRALAASSTSSSSFVSASMSASMSVGARNGTRGFRSSACRREQYLDVDEKTFDRLTSTENSKGRLLMVDFYADWCGPCRMLSPILKNMTADLTLKSGSGDPVDLLTIDVDTEQELAKKNKIHSLPTVIMYKDGVQVKQFVGLRAEKDLRAMLEEL